MAGVLDRRSWDDGSAETAEENFNQAASALEALIAQRDTDVHQAMADYQADGVSAEYQAKEARWTAAASEVRLIIQRMRASLEQSGDIAQTTASKAAQAVAGIG